MRRRPSSASGPWSGASPNHVIGGGLGDGGSGPQSEGSQHEFRFAMDLAPAVVVRRENHSVGREFGSDCFYPQTSALTGLHWWHEGRPWPPVAHRDRHSVGSNRAIATYSASRSVPSPVRERSAMPSHATRGHRAADLHPGHTVVGGQGVFSGAIVATDILQEQLHRVRADRVRRDQLMSRLPTTLVVHEAQKGWGRLIVTGSRSATLALVGALMGTRSCSNGSGDRRTPEVQG